MKTPLDQTRNNLDVVRLSLALLVIFSHSYPLGVGSEVHEPFAVFTRQQATGGYIAVNLFFVISGFLIAASAERSRTVWVYLKKRVYRIYPAFCFVTLLMLVFFKPIASATFAGKDLLANLTNVLVHTLSLREFDYRHAFLGNPYPESINGSLWSISYEFWCYVGVAFLSVTRLLRSRTALAILFAGSLILSMYFSLSGWHPGGKILGVIFGYPPFWGRLLPMYLAGVLLYRVRDRVSIRPVWIIVSLCALAVAAVTPHGWSLIFPFAGTYLVFAFAYHPSIPHINATRFGDLSYGTYLYAFPIQQSIVRWIGHRVNPWLLFLMATPPTLLLALGSWYGIERWFLRRSHRAVANSPISTELSPQGVAPAQEGV